MIRDLGRRPTAAEPPPSPRRPSVEIFATDPSWRNRPAGPNQPPEGVEHLAKVVSTPGAVRVQQGQVGDCKVPFGISDVGVVRLAMGRYALNQVTIDAKHRNHVKMQTTTIRGFSNMAHILHIVDSFGAGGVASGVKSIVQLTSECCTHSILSLTNDLGYASEIPAKVNRFVVEPGITKLLGFTARLASVAKRTRCDLIHCNNEYAWLDAALASRLLRIPCIQTFHGTENPCNQRAKNFWKLRLASTLTASMTAVCRASREMLAEICGAPTNTIAIIENGVDVNRFAMASSPDLSLRDRLGLERKGFLVAHAAGLRPVKDQVTLVRAWAGFIRRANEGGDLPADLLIMGEGACRRQLTSLIESLGVSNSVHLLGQRKDLHQILPQCNAFMLTSRSEGLSYSILEAMACGLPVIATNVGGNSELVKHGVSGFLTPAGAVNQLSDALYSCYSDTSGRLRMGLIARSLVVERYNVERMAMRYIKIYKRFATPRQTVSAL